MKKRVEDPQGAIFWMTFSWVISFIVIATYLIWLCIKFVKREAFTLQDLRLAIIMVPLIFALSFITNKFWKDWGFSL